MKNLTYNELYMLKRALIEFFKYNYEHQIYSEEELKIANDLLNKVNNFIKTKER